MEYRDTFLRRGWRGIEKSFGFCTPVNRKMIERAGGPALLDERAAVNTSGNTGRTGRRSQVIRKGYECSDVQWAEVV